MPCIPRFNVFKFVKCPISEGIVPIPSRIISVSKFFKKPISLGMVEPLILLLK